MEKLAKRLGIDRKSIAHIMAVGIIWFVFCGQLQRLVSRGDVSHIVRRMIYQDERHYFIYITENVSDEIGSCEFGGWSCVIEDIAEGNYDFVSLCQKKEAVVDMSFN